MIHLTIDITSDLFVTLNESRTLDTGYYLFVFTHYTTKEVVNKIFNFDDDLSDYPERFNRFELDSSVLTDATPGMWKYDVYEQASSSNTAVTGLTKVENGIMRLYPATDFEFKENSAITTYKTFNG